MSVLSFFIPTADLLLLVPAAHIHLALLFQVRNSPKPVRRYLYQSAYGYIQISLIRESEIWPLGHDFLQDASRRATAAAEPTRDELGQRFQRLILLTKMIVGA